MPHRLIITLVMTPCVGGITGGCQGATPFIGAARRWVGVEEPNSGCCCWSLGDACQGGGKETQQQLWGAEGHPGMRWGDSRAEGPRRCHQQGQAAPWALAGSPGAPPFRAGACHRVALLGQGWVLGLAWWQEQPWVAAPCASSPCLGGRGSRSPPGALRPAHPGEPGPRGLRASGRVIPNPSCAHGEAASILSAPCSC